jgi:hypothetical protein
MCMHLSGCVHVNGDLGATQSVDGRRAECSLCRQTKGPQMRMMRNAAGVGMVMVTDTDQPPARDSVAPFLALILSLAVPMRTR